MVVNTCITICYVHSTGNGVYKTNLLTFHRLYTVITVVKTGMTILNSLSTSFVVVKMGLGYMYRASTGFAVVKWAYNRSTCI